MHQKKGRLENEDEHGSRKNYNNVQSFEHEISPNFNSDNNVQVCTQLIFYMYDANRPAVEQFSVIEFP